jgi:hypothetical protein
MKTEEIISEWVIDSEIDKTELGKESLRIPQLHSKYLNEFYMAKTTYVKLNQDYKNTYKLKYQYYQGLLSKEELDENGWDIQPLKILKADIPVYIESDEDLQLIKNKIQLIEDKVEILENIIKTLNNRGYLIKNAIEWARFQNGL